MLNKGWKRTSEFCNPGAQFTKKIDKWKTDLIKLDITFNNSKATCRFTTHSKMILSVAQTVKYNIEPPLYHRFILLLTAICDSQLVVF